MKDRSAFPTQLQADRSQILCDASPGMTLRDYFAGQVVAGWNEVYHSAVFQISGGSIRGGTYGPQTIAKIAYLIADAMLTESGDNATS